MLLLLLPSKVQGIQATKLVLFQALPDAPLRLCFFFAIHLKLSIYLPAKLARWHTLFKGFCNVIGGGLPPSF